METMHLTTSAEPAPRRARDLAGFSLADELREPGQDPLLSPTRYIDLLKLDINTIAINAHFHRNTVSRAPGAASVQNYLR